MEVKLESTLLFISVLDRLPAGGKLRFSTCQGGLYASGYSSVHEVVPAAALLQKNQAMNAPEPCEFPFLLQAFDLSVAKRFCCMESPTLNYVAKQDQPNVVDWCYQLGGCGCTPQLPAPLPLSYSFVSPA